MLRDDDLSWAIRNDLLNKSKKPVWLEQFDEQIQAIEHPERIWREPPVDIITFAEQFLDRRNLTDFHRDFFTAYGGLQADSWDEKFKVYGLCWGQGQARTSLSRRSSTIRFTS